MRVIFTSSGVCSSVVALFMVVSVGAVAQFPLSPGGDPEASMGAIAGRFPQAAVKSASRGPGPIWNSAGPAPALFGQVENIAGNNPVIGAIHTVAAHPTDADILYLGATNGGVWKSTNATAASPIWVPLTDFQTSLSIGALEFDPTDATHNTLVAGIGKYSSFSRLGGLRTGLLRTTNGGSTWTELSTMVGRNISGVAPRGNVIVCSVNVADSFTFANVGIFRSTNSGATFTQISTGNGTTTGLPGGVSYDLASDPTNSARLYTSMVFAPLVSGVNGVYRSNDTGATWSKVSNAALDAFISDSTTTNVEIAVGNSGEVYVGIVNNGRADAMFRSPNGNAGTWIQLDTPATNENGVDIGLNPSGGKGPGPGSPPEELAGGQGTIHFSIRADPSNANVVYVGGDRQPHANEGIAGPVAFPNSIGANDYSGRLFRGNASAAAGSQFVHLTHSPSLPTAGTLGGTSGTSAPHADSREMVFDASGNLIEVDDGGIYKRTTPGSKTGNWVSIIGTGLAVTEMHDVVYDPVSNIIISGNQDTGTTFQSTTGSQVWSSLTTADGGDVAVAVNPSIPSQSIRYSSFQNLGAFIRVIFDSNNNLISFTYPTLTPSGGSPALQPNFLTPVVVNEVAYQRLVFGASNRFYESLNEGATITDIGPGLTIFAQNAIAYGGRKNSTDNPNVLYYADNTTIYRRVTAGNVAAVTNPFPGSTVTDIVLDPTNHDLIYVSDITSSIYRGVDNSGTVTWSDVTGNLPAFGVRALEYIPATNPFLVVGGNNGVYQMPASLPGSWSALGSGIPNTLIWDMDYHSGDDILVVGTMGRGAWTLTGLNTAATPTPSPSPTVTASPTTSPSPSPTATTSPTASPTVSPTVSPSTSPSPTASPSASPTQSVTPTLTAAPTASASPTNTPVATSTDTPIATITQTPQPTATGTTAPTNTPQPTATGTQTPQPTATGTTVPTNTPQPTATGTQTPQPTATGTTAPTNTPQPTATGTQTPQPTATGTTVPTNTPQPSPTSSSLRVGDIDGDGTIGSEDLRLLLDFLSGADSLTSAQRDRADFNRDGTVDASDYIGIGGNLD